MQDYSFQNLFSNVPRPAEVISSRLYLVTTENYKKIHEKESTYEVVGKAVLFTGGFFGLNWASRENLSNQQIEYLINVDYCSEVKYFWKELTPIIINNDRKTTIKKIKELIFNKTNLFYENVRIISKDPHETANENLIELDLEIYAGMSWLSTDKKFEKIQSIFKAKKFASILADFTEEKATEEIAAVLNKHSLTLDSIYLSNIQFYTETLDKLANFQNAMEKFKNVSTEKTYLLDSKIEGSHFFMRVRNGFNKSSAKNFFPASRIPVGKNVLKILDGGNKKKYDTQEVIGNIKTEKLLAIFKELGLLDIK